jgi:hypothetical protein
MIESMSNKQRAAVYTAWLALLNPRSEFRHENPGAFEAGKRWAIGWGFDAVLVVVEFCVWSLVCDADAATFDDEFDYFYNAMTAEISEAELESIKDNMDIDYCTARGSWASPTRSS